MPQVQSVTLKVGLEIHVELATRSKMFASAPSIAVREFEEAEGGPNTLLDPVVLGLPGALPVINRAAVEMSILVGLALNSRIARTTHWDRKGYFYPDMPKNYQISQYPAPLCEGGSVELPPLDAQGRPDWTAASPGSSIRIIRAHLEEDAGKLSHEAPGGHAIEGSLVDWNRAGTPLLEIVTEPDFTSADQVVAFAQLLRTTLRFLGVTQGVMQKGHIRFEPNINTLLTLDDGRRIATPVVEIKNLNSFRALKGAIEWELAEQPRRYLADGREMGRGVKRTYGWDDNSGRTIPQRDKEDADDYRYFPDPDLPPLTVSGDMVEDVRARLPELPAARMRRYAIDYALSSKDVTALTEERPACEFFESAVAASKLPPDRAGKLCANLVLQAGAKRANERAGGIGIHELGITGAQTGAIARMRDAGTITANSADELFGLLCERAEPSLDPTELARDRGLLVIRDDASLDRWCDDAIAANPQAASDVRAGKMAAMGRLVGAVMKLSAGAADAAQAKERLTRKLV